MCVCVLILVQMHIHVHVEIKEQLKISFLHYHLPLEKRSPFDLELTKNIRLASKVALYIAWLCLLITRIINIYHHSYISFLCKLCTQNSIVVITM